MQKTKTLEQLLIELEKEFGPEFFENINDIDKSDMTLEELEDDIDKHIQMGLKEYENGKYVTSDEFFKKWDDFFGA